MNGVDANKNHKAKEAGYYAGGDYPMAQIGAKGAPETTCEEASLVAKQHRVNIRTAVRMRIAVLVVSWLSVIILGILGIGTFVVAILDESSASFAFALDAILDSLSSIVVIWRYSGNSGSLYSVKRESIACIILGILFMISAITISVRATISLVDNEHPDIDDHMWYLFMVNGIICSALLIAKVYLGYELESRALITDAINSGLGAILSFTSLLTNLFDEDDNNAWLADPIMGLVCSGVLLLYGIGIVVESTRRYKKFTNEHDVDMKN